MSNDHRGFFAGKKLKASYTLDDEDQNEAEEAQKEQSARDQTQSVRRIEKLSTAVQDALVNRVQDPGGDRVMRVTFDEFMKMKDDQHFQSFAQYCTLILNYASGAPRPQPLRPFLENEVGMYNGKIVCLTNNPGDGTHTGAIIGMKTPEMYKREREAEVPPSSGAVAVEPDPFPSPKMTLITDED